MDGKPRRPNGYTVIDHKIRNVLNLAIDEYVIADMIYRYNQSHKVGGITYRRYYSEVGLEPLEVIVLLRQLKAKGILFFDKKKERIATTSAWNQHFNVDEMFKKLWEIHPHGNRQEALEAFSKSRLIVPFNTLLERLQEYRESRDDPQYLLKLSNWLDPKKKHWEDKISSNGKSKNDDSIPINLFA